MQNRRQFIRNSLLLTTALGTPYIITASAEFISDKGFSKADLTGKSDPALFGKNYKLRKETYESLESLIRDAKKSGFDPYVVSSYRNYAHQKRIWDNKYVKFTKEEKLTPQKAIEKIIAYSTIPGTSRHHWGTDFDIIDGAKGIQDNPLHEKHFNPGGAYHEFKLWLNKYASNYDFYEVYTNEKGRKGFKYEPWHFSYLPTACEMMSEYINKKVINDLYSSDIKGSEHFTEAFVSRYYLENVLDINPMLIP